MRLSLRAVGMALVITALATSGRCDDNDRGPFVFTTTADWGATPPPPAAPAPAIADVPAQPCDNLAGGRANTVSVRRRSLHATAPAGQYLRRSRSARRARDHD